MKLIIDIPEKMYKEYVSVNLARGNGKTITDNLLKAIKNGTPLPKGHGRLSDMDELVKNIVKEYGVNSIHELPQDIKMFYDKFINSAPTILDATFDYKLKNYAFFDKESEQ